MNATSIGTIVVILTVSLFATPATVASAASKGEVYATPDKAVEAFIGALRSSDVGTLVKIFGEGSERLFQSEDPVADQSTRARFLAAYDEKHEFSVLGNGSRVLVVGTEAWPFPIPLVMSGKGWAFDTKVGSDEIINRRIGRNELQTIQTCLAAADAQREYYVEDRDGDGILEYAQKFRSAPGLHDGLFWPVKEGEPMSPLGELVAEAADEGYTAASSSYHGYHYRLLTAQGQSAPGGAYGYMARGNQIGGFAILAYPAAYGDSGIMTFIVSHAGIVYQRDLGKSTESKALKITTFDPGKGWTKVPDKDLEPLPEE